MAKSVSFFILIFAFSAFAQVEQRDLSVEEFNRQAQQRKNVDYQNFQNQWFSYLRGETKQIPEQHSPAFVRQATEEFLLLSGGLKAQFAQASRENDFGFTFLQPDDDPYRKASFHRTHRSIYMNIERLTASEWLILFVHEVAHSLDSELVAALPIYNDEAYIKELDAYGKANGKWADMAVSEQQRLEKWLIAGLNRGFLAEYRAWLLTAVIYEEGLQQGVFAPSPWLEELKNSKPAKTSMQTHVLRYLSPSWVDPTEGIFSYSFIQEALHKLRQQLDANPSSVKLGAIEKLLKN